MKSGINTQLNEIVILQFYADLPNSYTNKLFTFKVNSTFQAFRIMFKFALNNNTFRNAWLNRRFIVADNKFYIVENLCKKMCVYFNEVEYDQTPTLNEAWTDFKMFLE